MAGRTKKSAFPEIKKSNQKTALTKHVLVKNNYEKNKSN